MKIGDLVRVRPCDSENQRWMVPGSKCGCFFCAGKSNRIGFVVGPAPRDQFAVMFDCGEWRLGEWDEKAGDVEVINEGR